MKILEVAVAERWAMTEPWVRTVLEIAGRENPSIEAVEARLGRKMDNSRSVTVRDGVAVIPVTGPIFRRANLFTEISGATSIEVLAQDFTSAIENGAVKAIVLNVDSPGGTVNGVHEFAEMVHAARGKGKPIVAYVGNMAASAAYWIASAADEIVGDDTAAVGSIGVVAVIPDPSKKTTKDLEIVSSQSPKKRLDMSTDAGKSEVQKEIDALADIFIGRVARNRGVDSDKVMASFGEGGMKLASDAIAAGMMDRRGSFEGLISNLAASQRLSYVKSTPRAAATETNKMATDKTFMSRVALFFGLSEENAPETTADATMAAIEEQKATIERLQAELTERDTAKAAAVAAKEKEAEEERTKRVEAEITAAVAQYGTKLGRESEEKFVALLRGVKAAERAEALAGSLLAFMDALPVAGSTARVDPADVDTEAVADKAAGTDNPVVALNASIEATLNAKGIKRTSPEWGSAFAAEFARVMREAKK